MYVCPYQFLSSGPTQKFLSLYNIEVKGNLLMATFFDNFNRFVYKKSFNIILVFQN